MEGMLTRDIAPEKQEEFDDMFDFSGPGETSGDNLDIDADALLPDDEPNKEEETNPEPKVEEESTKEPKVEEESTAPEEAPMGDDDVTQLLKELGVESDKQEEQGEEQKENIEGAIEKVEKLSEDSSDTENNDEVLEKLYEDLLNAQANEKAQAVTNEILESKVRELQEKYDKQRLGGDSDISDPDAYVITTQLEQALSGGDTKRIIQSIKNLYLKVTGENLDDALTKEEVSSADAGIQYGADTMPTVEPEPEEEPTGTILDILG